MKIITDECFLTKTNCLWWSLNSIIKKCAWQNSLPFSKNYKENNLQAKLNLIWFVSKIKAAMLSKIKKCIRIMLLGQLKFETLTFGAYFTVIKVKKELLGNKGHLAIKIRTINVSLSLWLWHDRCSNSELQTAAVKTNSIAEAKHTKMTVIGSEEHSLSLDESSGMFGNQNIKNWRLFSVL